MFLDLYEHLVLEDKPNPDDIFKSVSSEEFESRMPKWMIPIFRAFPGECHVGSWGYAIYTGPTKLGDFVHTMRKLPGFKLRRDGRSFINKESKVIVTLGDFQDAVHIILPLTESEKPNPNDIFKSASEEEVQERLPQIARWIIKRFGGKIYTEELGYGRLDIDHLVLKDEDLEIIKQKFNMYRRTWEPKAKYLHFPKEGLLLGYYPNAKVMRIFIDFMV